MSQETINKLTDEVRAKLEEIRQVAVETNTAAYFRFGYHSYQVYLPDNFDEDTNDYLQNEYDIEVGQWISSSELC